MSLKRAQPRSRSSCCGSTSSRLENRDPAVEPGKPPAPAPMPFTCAPRARTQPRREGNDFRRGVDGGIGAEDHVADATAGGRRRSRAALRAACALRDTAAVLARSRAGRGLGRRAAPTAGCSCRRRPARAKPACRRVGRLEGERAVPPTVVAMDVDAEDVLEATAPDDQQPARNHEAKAPAATRAPSFTLEVTTRFLPWPFAS